MTCQDIQDLLTREGKIDGSTEAAMETHLQQCPSCQRDWGEAERLSEQWKPASVNEPHLTNEQIIEMAEEIGVVVTAEQRRRWRHVLHCEVCYEAVEHLRACLQDWVESAEATTPVPAERIWAVWQDKHRMIGLLWVGAALVLKTARARRAPSVQQRGGGEMVEVTEEFGDYQLGVKFKTADAQQKKCKMELTLNSRSPAASVNDVIATLSQAGEDRQSLVFRDSALRLPAQGLGEYQLTLTRPAGELIGVVNLQISEE